MELARQIKHVKVENDNLRSKLLGWIKVMGKECRRLVQFWEKPGAALRNLATIVTPEIIRWIREE